MKYHELVISSRDAEVLALMLALEAAAANALADLLLEARLVPEEKLPADRVAMNSKVRILDAARKPELRAA